MKLKPAAEIVWYIRNKLDYFGIEIYIKITGFGISPTKLHYLALWERLLKLHLGTSIGRYNFIWSPYTLLFLYNKEHVTDFFLWPVKIV